MNKRILIIGGVAGGASVAARARRLDAGAEIIMFERGQHVSFSNCALPYYLSGVVGNSDALVMMSPEKFKKSYDIDARVNSEVMAINRDKKTIEIKNTLTGDVHEEAYDVLVMAPGASPVKPRSIGGIDGKNVYTVRNVADIVHLKDGLEAAGAENTAVIGGGFIGIEVAENLAKAGKKVTVVEAMSQILIQENAEQNLLQASEHEVNILIPFEGYPRDVYTAAGNGAELEALYTRVEAEEATGGTDIYYAAMEGLRQLENYDLSQYTPAIILLTDGVSDGSFSDFRDGYETFGADVPVFSIMFGSADPTQLEELADLTHARVFDGREDLIGAFRSVKGYN